LPQAALVVCHAGLGTVMAALSHGVPLVCLPMGRDQGNNAQRVASLGAGRTLAGDASRGEIRDAVARVLRTSSHHDAARGLQETIAACGWRIPCGGRARVARARRRVTTLIATSA
jgi:UDP:flavonoid glycosyltransferase YjiC (YdhE family)